MKNSQEKLAEIETLQKEDDGKAMPGMGDDSKVPEPDMDDYNQDKDADLSGIKVGGRHFVIKAPPQKTDAGIILSEKQQKEVQDVQDTPGFNTDFTVVIKSEKCELVEEGDYILLSPHVQALDIEFPADDNSEDKVKYLMIHEDYVLLAKASGE